MLSVDQYTRSIDFLEAKVNHTFAIGATIGTCTAKSDTKTAQSADDMNKHPTKCSKTSLKLSNSEKRMESNRLKKEDRNKMCTEMTKAEDKDGQIMTNREADCKKNDRCRKIAVFAKRLKEEKLNAESAHRN